MIIKQLWQHLSNRRKKQGCLLVILMTLASLMEVVSIGAVVPFLAALTSPEKIYNYEVIQPLINILGITNSSQLVLPFTAFFIIATISAALVRLLLLYVSTRFSYAVGADLSISIYRRTLYQDYTVHTSRNSSEIINSIITKTNTVIGGILAPTVTFMSSIFLMSGIVTVVFVINAEVAMFSFSAFASFYVLVAFYTRKSLRKNSDLIAEKSTQMIKSLQEGLGGIRDVLIDGSQEFYCKLYQSADLPLRRATGHNIFIAGSPRYLMEAVGMVLIASLAYVLTLQQNGLVSAIPVLGALAVGAQKLLPALQQAYGSYSAIKGSKSSFDDVLDLLNQPLTNINTINSTNPLVFKKKIVMENLSFRYSEDSPWILKDVNLSFVKGQTVGIVGVTGSGKSTLLDILMGLLTPTLGQLKIDSTIISKENKKSWQSHISHVPQSIYLADSTIQENIAFGINLAEIKKNKVVEAAKQAEISEMINNLQNTYDAFVGERGVQLSGGQRQRIGIARALYKNSAVIVFDEATSALDNQTEEIIMKQITKIKSDQTVFLIAHRLTTLKQCNTIIKLNTDFTIQEVTYSELLNN